MAFLATQRGCFRRLIRVLRPYPWGYLAVVVPMHSDADFVGRSEGLGDDLTPDEGRPLVRRRCTAAATMGSYISMKIVPCDTRWGKLPMRSGPAHIIMGCGTPTLKDLRCRHHPIRNLLQQLRQSSPPASS